MSGQRADISRNRFRSKLIFSRVRPTARNPDQKRIGQFADVAP